MFSVSLQIHIIKKEDNYSVNEHKRYHPVCCGQHLNNCQNRPVVWKKLL